MVTDKKMGNVLGTDEKTQKSKQEVKKELDEPLINGDVYENQDMEEKSYKVERCNEATAIIREYEEITRKRRISYG